MEGDLLIQARENVISQLTEEEIKEFLENSFFKYNKKVLPTK
jgi:hypothetical protein